MSIKVWVGLLGGLVGFCCVARPSVASALEEQSETLSASVEVASVFSLSLSNPHLAFDELTPGRTTILGEGRFFNEVSCRSNSGRSWFLTAQLLSLREAQGRSILAPSQLQWNVVEATGAGGVAGGRGGFRPFADQPVLIYSSQGDDVRGRPVALRFQYSLSCPLDAPAGFYVGELVFTMSEGL